MSNTRFLHLLILAALSLFIAAVCYFLGGLAAHVVSATPIQGVTFEAGGSLAGFLISFIFLFRAYQKTVVTIPLCKVTVTSPAGPFTAKSNPFAAQITIMKYASGKTSAQSANVIWEAGGLTVHLRDLEIDDLVMISLTDGRGKTWKSNHFSPLCSDQTLR